MKTIFLSISLIGITTILAFTKPKVPELKAMNKILKQVYSYIPPGKTIVNGDTVDCSGFFMSKFEISNFNYREYLLYLKKHGKIDEYKQALPDTAKWSETGRFQMEKYTDHYFNHPVYRDYPAVNITRQQAEKYCEWLTQLWKEYSGNETVLFRLPTKAEFLRAANGSSLERPYSWNTPFLRRSDGKFQCNFLAIGAGAISRDTATGKLIVMNAGVDYLKLHNGDFVDVTAPVQSFWPNEFGIYHLNGNVAEMISDGNWAVGGDWNSPGFDIRNQSIKAFTEADPTVGFRPVLIFTESQN